MLPDPTHLSVATSKGWVKKQRSRRRRLQLAAALIEADNPDIDRRITFLIHNDPRATDLLAHLTKLIKYAKDSVIFRDSTINCQEYERPVYTYRLSTQRELSRGYLNLQQDCDLEDASLTQEQQAEDFESSDAGKNSYEHISFSFDQFGSPVLNVLEQAPSIEVAAQNYAEQEQQKALQPPQEKDTRAQRLLERIHELNTAVHTSPAQDISFSSTEDASISKDHTHDSADLSAPEKIEPEEAVSEREEERSYKNHVDGLGIRDHEPRHDLISFRERVLNRKSQVSPSEAPHHRDTESIVPVDDDKALLEESLNNDTQNLLHGSEMTTRQLNSMAKGASHFDASSLPESHGNNDTGDYESQKKSPFKLTTLLFQKKEKPSRLLIPAVSRLNHEINRTPILDDLSPIPDSYETANLPFMDNILPAEGEMMGVSLQSPSIPTSLTKLNSNEEPPTSAETLKPPVVSALPLAEANSSYMTYADETSPANQTYLSERDALPLRRHSWAPTYVCIPAPLQDIGVQTSEDTFYVPQGAFKLEHGSILPTLTRSGDSYGPIQVPLGLGRRALYPSTALFRNVLVTRDYDKEGWGWDRYTNSAEYFQGIHADDDDSDDELPLMDVRIHRREKHLAQKRVSREKKRQRRARAERRRLRALAREKGKPASAYGVTEESSDENLSDASSDYEISSDETDPEVPWKDDLRPAGKLYGKSLMGTAEAEKTQRENEIRFYGQLPKEDAHEQHPFHNDTRERMRRIFGEQAMLQAGMGENSLHREDSHATASRLKDLASLIDQDVPEHTRQATPEQMRAMEAVKEHELDEHVADAWKDDSSEDEAASEALSIAHKPQRRSRASNWPRWMEKNEDDVPLSELHPSSSPPSEDDTLPLASKHPQAEVIAEKEAIIRRLEEENRQVRMLLQMRTSVPPMPLQPWMMPMGGMMPPPSASMGGSAFLEQSPFVPALPPAPGKPSEFDPSLTTHEDQHGILGWLSERDVPDT